MNTISLEKPKNLIHWLQVYRLYLAAFPKAERKPFFVIKDGYRNGKMDVWCIRQKGVFTGLVITINSEDLILIDVATRKLEIVGVKGEEKTPEEMEAILAERRKNWTPKEPRYKDGVLAVFTKLADSPMKGGMMHV